MRTRARDLFATIRSEGGILPPDLLERIAAGDGDLDGLTPGSYHLAANERLGEAAGRSWNRLLGAWAAFEEARQALAADDPGTTLTRERWLLILFQELGYGRLQGARAVEIEGKRYPISHLWGPSPIHLIGCRVELDRRTAGVAGAATASPHSMVQELLNRSSEHLWAFVSNGLVLRVLRDNVALTRQAFLEFDLEEMMVGEVYSDFVLLWLVCHESRVEAERPADCWLERWSQQAAAQGVRALDQLRDGVAAAIEALGRGFLAHPGNGELREGLRAGRLDTQDYYRQLLRIVYRLLFLFAAEDRDLLLDPAAQRDARQRYERFYSTRRLRVLAGRRRGSKHHDLYEGLRVVSERLAEVGCPPLALPVLGSFLWAPRAVEALAGARLSNEAFLDAVRALAYAEDRGVRRPVDFKNLGAEELGSVYESLLELHPELNVDAASFRLATAAGHERKTTGSYYTPTSLITSLLDSALEPVLDEATRTDDPVATILDLKVCDPACGSGHFLIAAAHRIAKLLAALRTGDAEPSPEALRGALSDVIGRCIYGVDVNPMAVELCKVALWMEAVEPGRPLSFLDGHIKCGNSLVAADSGGLADGIPDKAFQVRDGDDKDFVRLLKRRNAIERDQHAQLTMAIDDGLARLTQNLASLAHEVDRAPSDTIQALHQKERRFQALLTSHEYARARLLGDTWCTAFIQQKHPDAGPHITHGLLRRVALQPADVSADEMAKVAELASEHRFFHWEVEFPDVLSEDRQGRRGFDLILGNPPWIRQESLRALKALLATYPSYKSTADLSVFFVDLSCRLARIGGYVALLTPNKWFRSDYGGPLRAEVAARTAVELIVDFGHSRILFDADTFPAAIVLRRRESSERDARHTRFVRAHDSDREQAPLDRLIREHAVMVPAANLTGGAWRLESGSISALLDRLTRCGFRLPEYLGRPPLVGLKSGFNAAFYIDSNGRDTLVENDPDCAPLLKRMLRGRDIGRWQAPWNQQWHIVIPSSQNTTWPWSGAPTEDEAEQVFASTYPSVYRQLAAYKTQLQRRTDKGRFWWELRSCDYYPTFDEPKVLVQCIAFHPRFAFEAGSRIVNNKVILLPDADGYLLAVLNSRPTWWLMNRTFQTMKDGGLSVDVQYLSGLPVPEASSDLREEAAALGERLIGCVRNGGEVADVLRLEEELNRIMIAAFELSTKEQAVLETSLPARDPIASLRERMERAA